MTQELLWFEEESFSDVYRTLLLEINTSAGEDADPLEIRATTLLQGTWLILSLFWGVLAKKVSKSPPDTP